MRPELRGISLLAGKKQGISSVLASVNPIWHRKSPLDQSLTAKFPAHRNRELIGLLQGINPLIKEVFGWIREDLRIELPVPILGESADQLVWFALKWRLLTTVLMATDG